MIRALLATIAAWLVLGTSAAQADYWGRWEPLNPISMPAIG